MIRKSELLSKFENDFLCNEGRLSFNNALKLFTNMWYEGCRLGVLPPRDPLEGVEIDIKISKVVKK